MKNIYLIAVLISCLINLGSKRVTAQFQMDSTGNFFTMTAYYDAFYDSLILERGIENMRGTGYKDYLRWKWFYSYRHGVNGELSSVIEGIWDYYENYQYPEGYTDYPDWEFSGPLGIPLKHNNAASFITGKGMMLSLWVSDGDHSLIYAGSHHGGLWKTTDGGDNWYPMNDEDPRIHGVNSIAVDPDDHQTIYFTGNNSLGDFSKYTAGLFKSTDGGVHNNLVNLPGVSYPTAHWGDRLRKIVIHPNPSDPDEYVLFLIGYQKVFRSFDKGDSWGNGPVFSKNWNPWDPPNPPAAETFYNHNGLFDFKVTPWDYNTAYLAGSEIFKVTDPFGDFDTLNISDYVFLIGLDTQQGDQMVNNPHRCEISMHGNFGGYVWFCYAADYIRNGQDTMQYFRIVRYYQNDFELIYENTNSGHPAPYLSGNMLEFSVSPSNMDIFYIAGVYFLKLDMTTPNDPKIYKLYGSPYPDACWLHPDIRDMVIFSGGGKDTLFTANDAGISWGVPFAGSPPTECENAWQWHHPFSSTENGLNVTEFYGIGVSPVVADRVAGGCQDLGAMLLTDEKWINFGRGDGSELVFSPDNPEVFYFGEWQSSWLYRTNNLGETDGLFYKDMGSSSIIMPMELDPYDPSVLYAGGKDLLRFAGVDDFSQGVDAPVPLKSFEKVLTDIEVVKTGTNGRRIYVSTMKGFYPWDDPPPPENYTGCIFYSNNNGQSFTDISKDLMACHCGFISDIEVNPYNPDQIWVSAAVYSKSTPLNNYQDNKVFTRILPEPNWQDFSEGLPPGLPVFKIKYIPQIGRLLAATDVGVFKRDATDDQWYPYQSGLPGKIVTDLEVNMYNHTVYAATYGRGLWKQSPILCDYNEPPWTIDQDLTWERDTILDRSIVITNGATVTVKDCRIYMPDQAKITVHRSSELVLDGCTLSSACNDLWWGVEVWGDSRSMQSSGIQGRIELKNGAVIEKARRAVFCGKNIENTYPDWEYTGGIVDARDAVFKNNQSGVLLWSYPYQNTSRFIDCKFQTTELLLNGEYPDYFMILVQVKGIEIENCEFEYLLWGVPDYREHGRGIFALDAGFEILPKEEGKPSATFRDLYYGIFAMKVFEDQDITVQHAKFAGNITGIYATGIQNLTLERNDFLVTMKESPAGNQVFGGVYLDQCSGYSIQENQFVGDILSQHIPSNVGITINNSGEDFNEIYKNNFSDLYTGTLAQNRNRSIQFLYGLKIKCNVYTNNEYDIAVTGYSGCTDCGIALYQGVPGDPAGNLFSHKDITPFSDFNNEMAQVDYYHHRPVLFGENPWIPLNYSTETIERRATLEEWNESSCPSLIEDHNDKGSLQNMLDFSSSKADSLETLLQQLTDGGNTNLLSMDITFAQPDDALDLHDQLMSLSPYLSDTILIQSIEKEDVLLPVMVKEIMVANPQSAKAGNILEALDNRQNQIPGYMMAEILQGKDTLGHKEILGAELSYWKAQKETAVNRLISIYRKDTLTVSTDSIAMLLESLNTLSSKYRLATMFMALEDTLSALDHLNQAGQQFNMTAMQSSTHQDWLEWFDIMLQFKRDSLKLQEQDSSLITRLHNLAESDNLPGCHALNLLHYLGIDETGPYYLLPGDNLKLASKPLSRDELKATGPAPHFRIYPNPARNHLIVEYNVAGSRHDALLIIYSPEGKVKSKVKLHHDKHHTIINTKDWAAGIFFYNFITYNQNTQSGKIIIAR